MPLLKGHLDLEQHDGRTPEGIMARVQARILALTAATWHNDKTSQSVKRSLIACDHRKQPDPPGPPHPGRHAPRPPRRSFSGIPGKRT
jgi:hypothetical protein